MESKDFLEELLATFKTEADEHLNAMSAALIELEKAPNGDHCKDVVETIYRAAHSLKGAARAVDIADIEMLCQSAESLLATVKSGQTVFSRQHFDTMHRVVDAIRALLSSPDAVPGDRIGRLRRELTSLISGATDQELTESDLSEAVTSLHPQQAREPGCGNIIGVGSELLAEQPQEASVEEVVHHLREEGDCPDDMIVSAVTEREVVPEVPARNAASAARSSEREVGIAATIRIPANRLDTLLLEAEEMLSAKLAAAQRAAQLQKVQSKIQDVERVWSTASVGFRQIEDVPAQTGGQSETSRTATADPKLLDLVGRHQDVLRSLRSDIDGLARTTEQDSRLLDTLVDNLLEDAKKLLMLPCSTMLQPFPKMVRDIARDLGKEVDLELAGTQVELDKGILEKLKDPLIHLVRNSIDHGIETPEERLCRQKPRKGTIRLSVRQVDSSRVEVEVSDDGAGIDLDKVRKAAVKSGLVSAEAAPELDAQATLSLIFESGLSTSKLITDISGRGLGMAIVKEKIDELGGKISIDSTPYVGSVLRILLPVQRATFRGVFVRVSGQLFLMPTNDLERVCQFRKSEIASVAGRDSVTLNDTAIPLAHLADILELPRCESKSGDLVHALILGSGAKQIAFRVDEALQEQEVLVKPLGRQLSRVRNIAGATVLSSGEVVQILNARDLVKSAAKTVRRGATVSAADTEEEAPGQRSILLVEDSITSRTLLKSVLESAGYRVSTAVDGMDALTSLKVERFDLVVSDVEMPRMDGFTLTERIRSDKELESLPVIIVTSLESREHRERGVDVGANAYIVKSTFDQVNLLDTVGRLI